LPDADYSTLRKSVFSIHFRIDGPSSALVRVDGGMYGISASTQELTCVLLFAGTAIVDGRCSDPFNFNFGFRTSIEPGDYELRATAPGHPGDGGGAYGFTFSIAENVPEPDTALLLALGMGGLGGVSMRQRARSRARLGATDARPPPRKQPATPPSSPAAISAASRAAS
jgi:PEP-CTERM motif